MQNNTPKRNLSRDAVYQSQAILARRDHSEGEVRQKLEKRGFPSNEIESAILWLHKQHLLDDQAFAVSYARSLINAKPVGPRYIAAKLRQRQVSDANTEYALAKIMTGEQEQKLAQQATSSWRRQHASEKGPAAKSKLYRFLSGRGFSPDAVNEALATIE